MIDGSHWETCFCLNTMSHHPALLQPLLPKKMWELMFFFCDTQDKLDPLVIKVPEEILERQEYLGRMVKQGIPDSQVGVDSMGKVIVKKPSFLCFP